MQTSTIPAPMGRPPESARLVTPLELLRAIAKLQAETGFPPTTTALAEVFGVSSQTIGYHVARMSAKGWVLRRKHQPGVAITAAGRRLIKPAE